MSRLPLKNVYSVKIEFQKYYILPPFLNPEKIILRDECMGYLFSGNCSFWTGNFQVWLNIFLAVKFTSKTYGYILKNNFITAKCVAFRIIKKLLHSSELLRLRLQI